MDTIWLIPELSDAIINSEDIFNRTGTIVADLTDGKTDIANIVENMEGVLTSDLVDNRVKGMQFFSKILKELPRDYLAEKQLKFITSFYHDRLKDNHRVIPPTLDGYLNIIDMENYNVKDCSEFFSILFREVACQSQVREDRRKIYCTVQKLLDKNVQFMKTLGPDFIYGVISAMDGERDPRNLIFLFNFLPKFIANIPLGHLVEEMFEVISCYYPIDFHPSPNDPEAVTRDELADALAPCLCATQAFAEHCLPLLIEKLDSALRVAKLDSLKLLRESCSTFNVESYGPFLNTLWSSINREMCHKTDEELKMAAHEALSTLVSKLATSADTSQSFELFLKGVLISGQTSLAEASTYPHFIQAKNILMTCANASKESCIIIVRSMIPALIAYYGFNTSSKLQVASVYALGDMYEVARYWKCLEELQHLLTEIPQGCLTSASVPSKDYQIAGYKTLIKVADVLDITLVLPFVEILMHTLQHSSDYELLATSVETIHAIARKYPELIMDLVVKKQCDLDNLPTDRTELEKKLNLLCNLASVDDFTKVIIEDMLKIIECDNQNGQKVVEALNCSLSDINLYTAPKLEQIESDHGLIRSVLNWLDKEISYQSKSLSNELDYGYSLITKTISSLPIEKQQKTIDAHLPKVMEKIDSNEIYFMTLESLLNSLEKSVVIVNQMEIFKMGVRFSLLSENAMVRQRACHVIAHFLNKAEYGESFEMMYEELKILLAAKCKENGELCSRLIYLYGWVIKALIIRGSDLYNFWLRKIEKALQNPIYCIDAAEAIRLIMDNESDHLTTSQHCRVSIFYRQRFFQTFSSLDITCADDANTRQAYLLSWAYILERIPKTVINNQVEKFAPLVIESLDGNNKTLLLVMLEVLSFLVQSQHRTVADGLQTILPRLVKLSQYTEAMDVRIKSLQCILEIANIYPTALLLPYKSDLLLDLAPSLDDKKRLVRNVAVKARARWFLIGSPGEAKEN